MKKLFVLFLLVSLIPFAVGCSLFGDDSDDSASVNMTTLTASAKLPASAGKPSLRAATADKFANVTMKIGDVTLKAVSEEPTDNTNATYTVTFEQIVNTAVYQAATTGIVPVVISRHDGSKIEFAADFSTFSSPLSVSVDAAGTVSSSGTIYSNYARVTSITETKNTLTPEFTVVFNTDIVSVANPAEFDVKVTSGTTTVAASQADFNVSYTSATKTMKVSLKDKTLTDGKTYTVTINKLVSSSTPQVAVLSTSYTFTVKLTQ